MTRTRILLLAATTILGGCNLAPKYVRPVGAAPAQFPQGGAYPAARADAPADVALVGWRDFFTDPRLVAVIETGLANNRDLRIAAANILQARAQYRVQRADLLPNVTANGSATYTNSPLGAGGGVGGGTGVGTGVGVGAGGGATSTDFAIYSANVGFSSFELDLFGRLRNLSRAAQEQYFASEEAARTARISLIAEIGTAWATMASDQEQLRIARETLKTFEQTLELTRAQFRIGVASELESRQAETNYEGARNDVATLTTRIAQDQNALNLLVGTTVPAEQLPDALGGEDLTRDSLPSDLSSTVLLKRPDVLQAEHQLIAENANIGAARAAFFPQISLTGTLGTIGTALGGLFSSGSYTYTGSPAIGLPIFDGGRNRANLDYARASQQVAVATYERTIQTAFREVADALAQRGTIVEQVGAQTRRAEAARVAARLSDARYRAGVDSFLTSLDAQRTSYAAQQQLATTRLARINNLIELYRSLGGGLQ
ncbi:multidrug efflux system outer membrane protein [Novosphingobium chloroacetimidivorans]|uniref:Multidrug efflux system outer membrane protein n=1 Tax=Novosphingobium chloroacetimidivorans TaxID=1428314 RepID=A0A7W7NXF2_9SPHN|nr:efflux transporter outer membrane subunit [Novosphingobium chloroacetimidivorans]MBB4859399.1 multidrug efflux system outer membrane protein [Novosphingobium chloroacetimidivorans]